MGIGDRAKSDEFAYVRMNFGARGLHSMRPSL
jgi:hypothetical protein